MKVLVCGYHNVGYLCLRYLVEHDEDVVAVITHRDDPSENIFFQSVRELAEASGILVHFAPDDPRDPSFLSLVRSFEPDILFSFAFRKMLPKSVLDIPPRGCVNLHASLLPKYRGRCPVNWVLLHGEIETGVTLHYMVPKADAGDIIGQRRVPIALSDTAGTLHEKTAQAGAELFAEMYPLLKAGTAPRTTQDESAATYFGGRRPEDGLIDWTQPAVQVYNLVRAVTHPFPGAFSFLRKRKLFLWSSLPKAQDGRDTPPGTLVRSPIGGELFVGTGRGCLQPLRVQLEGEPEADFETFAEQWGLQPGESFTQHSTGEQP